MVQRKPWSLLSNPNKIAVRRLVDLLRHAKQDHTIGCLYATFGAETSNLAQAGWADLEEVRKAMADFAAEKEVLAVANTFNSASHKEYYLASIASTILVRETGEVNLLGLCISQMFQAQQLKEAGIKVHVFKSGLYKSAGNVYTESKFTPAERENKTDILWQIQNDTFESITTSRSRQLLQSTWPNMQRRKEQSAWTGMFWEHFMADESSLFPAVMSPYFLDIPDESESSESDKWHVKLVSVFQAALEPYAPVIIGAMQYIWKEIAHAFPFEVASTFDSGLEDAMPSDPQQIWTQILDEGVFPMLLAQQAGLVDHVLVADPTPTFLSTCPSVSLDEYDNEVEQQQRLAATRTLRKRKLLGSGQCLDFVHPQPTFQVGTKRLHYCISPDRSIQAEQNSSSRSVAKFSCRARLARRTSSALLSASIRQVGS